MKTAKKPVSKTKGGEEGQDWRFFIIIILVSVIFWLDAGRIQGFSIETGVQALVLGLLSVAITKAIWEYVQKGRKDIDLLFWSVVGLFILPRLFVGIGGAITTSLSIAYIFAMAWVGFLRFIWTKLIEALRNEPNKTPPQPAGESWLSKNVLPLILLLFILLVMFAYIYLSRGATP